MSVMGGSRHMAQLWFYLDRVAEVHSVKHGAFAILDVDTVVKNHAALFHRGLRESDPRLLHRVLPRSLQTGKFGTLFIDSVDVVVQVKIEPHDVV
jgi:hypothetical protein